MDVVRVLLQVPCCDIVLLCSILEGYEGIAVVRTVNPAQGLIELLVAPAFHAAALDLLKAIAQDIALRLIESGTSSPPSAESHPDEATVG
jgi:hypothetical protein